MPRPQDLLQDFLQDFLYEQDFLGAFLLVTIVLGGGAAFIAGRTIALTWRPWWQIVFYMLILGGAERFFHFALFGGTLLSDYYYGVDSLIAIAFGLLGFRLTRTQQMAQQYGSVLGSR
jgi:hypothetical protein